jgi:hypothetical protein
MQGTDTSGKWLKIKLFLLESEIRQETKERPCLQTTVSEEEKTMLHSQIEPPLAPYKRRPTGRCYVDAACADSFPPEDAAGDREDTQAALIRGRSGLKFFARQYATN